MRAPAAIQHTVHCCTVVVTCSYYNTGNYSTRTIEDRTTDDDKQINYGVVGGGGWWTPDNYISWGYFWFLEAVRTKNGLCGGETRES